MRQTKHKIENVLMDKRFDDLEDLRQAYNDEDEGAGFVDVDAMLDEVPHELILEELALSLEDVDGMCENEI